jgi:phage terminase Nu1 subunit (DNA packaging protein)
MSVIIEKMNTFVTVVIQNSWTSHGRAVELEVLRIPSYNQNRYKNTKKTSDLATEEPKLIVIISGKFLA